MSRAILPVAFVLCVLSLVGCGDDSVTSPQEAPEGFIAVYKHGDILGENGCRTSEYVYSCDVRVDWWTETPDEIDWVDILVPYNICAWTPELYCLDEGDYYIMHPTTKHDNHWVFNEDSLGDLDFWELDNVWFAYQLQPDSAAIAHVHFKDRPGTVYTTDFRRRR